MTNDKISLAQIQSALSEEGDPWEAGVTSLSLLSPEEQKRHLGVTPPPGEPTIDELDEKWPEMAAAQQSAAMQATATPSSYDLRDVGGRNFVTPVKDQQSCGSCVAFGTLATMESRLRVQRHDPNLSIDLSEAHLFFCLGRDSGASCTGGWWPAKAYDMLKTKGVVDEACYPYDLSDTECGSLCSNWSQRTMKITGYTNLTNKPAQIKQWISSGKGPVSACFIVYEDFFSYKSGVYRHVTGKKVGGHCVVIVGYDDSPGYWICKNSWGPGWGEQGFFRIAYGQCGIDSWGNHGIDAIENTGWHSRRQVNGLWASSHKRNAWAHFQGLGWKKISDKSDDIFFDMLAQLIAAKSASRPVSFYEEKGVIKQIYVL